MSFDKGATLRAGGNGNMSQHSSRRSMSALATTTADSPAEGVARQSFRASSDLPDGEESSHKYASSPSISARPAGTLYKTELCRSFQETRFCKYGSKCQFAHGADELKPISRHPKYKTEVCRKFELYGACPYGNRCRFIHKRGARALPSPSASPRVSTSGSLEQLPPATPIGDDAPLQRSTTPPSRRDSSIEEAADEALRRLPVFRKISSIDDGHRPLSTSRSSSLNSLISAARLGARHSSDDSWRRMSTASSVGGSGGSGSSGGSGGSGGSGVSAISVAMADPSAEWHPVAGGFPSPFVDPSAQLLAAALSVRRSLGSTMPAHHLAAGLPPAAPAGARRPRSTCSANLHAAAQAAQQQQQQQQQQQAVQQQVWAAQQQHERLQQQMQIQQAQQELFWRQQRQWQLQQQLLHHPAAAEADAAVRAELALLRSLA